jgi:hypothetical protein
MKPRFHNVKRNRSNPIMAVKEAKPLTEPIYTRAPYWNDVPDEKWMDWRWQMSNRLNSVAELARKSST